MATSPTAVNIDTLNTQQLSQIKKQLDDELEHITVSFNQLRAAQAKFVECLDSIKLGLAKQGSPEILVPLTNSLYCRGKLSSTSKVLVDIGTGFYVEKETSSARRFYEDKVSGLGKNLRELETIIQQKIDTAQSVDSVLQQKLAAITATAS